MSDDGSLLVILAAGLEDLDALVADEEILRALLTLQQSQHALASTQHHILVQVLQTLTHQVYVPVTGDEEGLGDGYLVPDLI